MLTQYDFPQVATGYVDYAYNAGSPCVRLGSITSETTERISIRFGTGRTAYSKSFLRNPI
jgi:hypothetical protein